MWRRRIARARRLLPEQVTLSLSEQLTAALTSRRAGRV